MFGAFCRKKCPLNSSEARSIKMIFDIRRRPKFESIFFYFKIHRVSSMLFTSAACFWLKMSNSKDSMERHSFNLMRSLAVHHRMGWWHEVIDCLKVTKLWKIWFEDNFTYDGYNSSTWSFQAKQVLKMEEENLLTAESKKSKHKFMMDCFSGWSARRPWQLNLPADDEKIIAKWMLCGHNLLSEMGIYLQIDKEERLCKTCSRIENESHVLGCCEVFTCARMECKQQMYDVVCQFGLTFGFDHPSDEHWSSVYYEILCIQNFKQMHVQTLLWSSVARLLAIIDRHKDVEMSKCKINWRKKSK